MGGCQSSCINQKNESFYELENGGTVYRKRRQNGAGLGVAVNIKPFENVSILL